MFCTPCLQLIKVLIFFPLLGITLGSRQIAIDCPTAKIKGTVTDDVEGTPIAGADVIIVRHDDKVLNTISGANGTYCAGGLPLGKPVIVRFRKNGYLPDPRKFEPIKLSLAETHLDVMLFRGLPDVNKSLKIMQARAALAEAKDALSGLESKDSIFREPASAVTEAYEQFKVGRVSTTIQQVKAARVATAATARKRRDRIKGGDGFASPADVDTALDRMDFALKKLAELVQE